MKNHRALTIVLLSVFLAGCRQPDAPTRTPTEEDQNRIYDMSRDLGAIATGDQQGVRDFSDDLVVVSDLNAAEGQMPVQTFAEKLGAAVSSVRLTDQSARDLAQTSWSLTSPNALSDRQVRALQEQLRQQLTTLGAPADRVDAAVAEMPNVQRAVTTRPRRWYEVF